MEYWTDIAYTNFYCRWHFRQLHRLKTDNRNQEPQQDQILCQRQNVFKSGWPLLSLLICGSHLNSSNLYGDRSRFHAVFAQSSINLLKAESPVIRTIQGPVGWLKQKFRKHFLNSVCMYRKCKAYTHRMLNSACSFAERIFGNAHFCMQIYLM